MNKTDWNHYYSNPYKTAFFSRKITGRLLIRLIKKHLKEKTNISIIELGGGNSSYYECLDNVFSPREYIVIDNNEKGINLFLGKTRHKQNASAFKADVLCPDLHLQADLVFSIGLIEHFSPEDTKKAIESHFSILNNQGVLIMSFPTPTFIYKTTRRISELLGLWIFHDERPLQTEEVINTLKKHGCLLDQRIVRSIFLSQAFIVAKKN
jgi:hypothetical protein